MSILCFLQCTTNRHKPQIIADLSTSLFLLSHVNYRTFLTLPKSTNKKKEKKNPQNYNKKKFEQTLAAGTKVKKLEALGSKIKKLISTNMKNGYISCRKDIFKPKL